MTRTVRDAAIILSAIAGADERDPFGKAAAPHVQKDYTKFLNPSLKGIRIGIPRKIFYDAIELQNEVVLINKTISLLRKAGAHIQGKLKQAGTSIRKWCTIHMT